MELGFTKIKNNGYTLIELVIFIIIVSIAAAGILLGMNVALVSQPDEINTRIAREIANTRIEYVVGQAKIVGFDIFSDNCVGSVPEICTHPAEFTVSTSIDPDDNNTNIKVITVEVSGAGYATLKTAVANL